MKAEFSPELWEPRTEIGKAVKEGKITQLSDILRRGYRILEPEIVDVLVPNLQQELLHLKLVQKMHKSGRRSKYWALVAVGNGDGFVGVGEKKSKEVATAISKAARAAKQNIIEVRRGCGSWECGCGQPHSVPLKVKGKSGSVEITLIPAPRGLGLVAPELSKKILRLAGIKDVWTLSRGSTKTRVNLAYATLEALRQTMKVSIPERR
ncbi:MAG: 30S ribosomal protein S5 [Candidatus Hadarchaeales archaeon]